MMPKSPKGLNLEGTHACDDCDVEPAEIKVVATTLDGEVLDSALLCRTCAEARSFAVGK